MAIAVPVTASAAAGDTEIQILGVNDFHGRISADGQNAGAAVLAGAVKQLETENPNTVFAGAGDLIGASEFDSFIDDDVPTIKALNGAGLEVSSVGNHEFDKGIGDIIKRVQPMSDWQYLAANITKKADASHPLPATWSKTVDGVKIGFVGAVTEHLSGLVSPAGIADVNVGNIAKAANKGAKKLKADGAQIVILLVHEGYPATDCSKVTTSKNDLSEVVDNLDPDIDAVISGHTHLAYNCAVPVKEWKDAGRAVTERPVMQAGKYGAALDQLVFTVDSAGKVTDLEAKLLPLTSQDADGDWSPNYPADPAVQKIVDKAHAKAKVLGAKSLGKVSGPLDRAKVASGDENRGGESNLGNLIADAQLTMMQKRGSDAQIAFMNPGGIRADIESANGKYPADVSYEQAATVQPFGDKVDIMDLTGAQIKTVLEQQWQPKGASRPILHLGLSKGFTYTYDPAAAKDHHITQMWLDGKPIDPKATYSAVVNDFLASGGDQFFEFANGTHLRETGRVDLQTFVNFMHSAADKSPLQVDNSQRSVGVTFPKGAPKAYGPGDTVKFTLSSLTFPMPKGPHRMADNKVTVKLGDNVLGTFKVDNTPTTVKDDETGTADVSVVLPDMVKAGNKELTIEGDVTGTVSSVPITVKAALASTGINAAMPTAIAALLLLIGSALILTTRRRRVTSQA